MGMVKGRGKRAARPRVNRLLGFAGEPTDKELDEVIALWARLLMRLLTSSELVHVMRSLRQFSGAFDRTFGDA